MRLSMSMCALLLAASASLSAAGAASAQTRMTVAPAAVRAAAQPAAALSLRDAIAPKARGVTIDENRIRTHVIRPSNTIGVLTDEGRGVVPALQISPALAAKLQLKGHLDVAAFGAALDSALVNNVAGYAVQLRQNGQTVYSGQRNWAKIPADGGSTWSINTQMHVASVSKLITAMAMTKLLDEKNISYDAKIIDYLPTYWAKGPNIDKITFRELMTQTSGFSTGGSDSDYLFMKGKVAAGVPANKVGTYDYENMNFGLCRILIAIINGDVDKDLHLQVLLAPFNDPAWDDLTLQAYKNYVQAKVFAPAGVTNATLDHPAGDALAYGFPAGAGGWNSGDVSSYAGGAAWHLSASQMLDVMNAFRRKGTIMPTPRAIAMLDNGFGIDLIQDTPIGKLYNKNGRWQNGARAEQSLAYFLPQNMELVVLTNSPVSAQDTFFRNVVTQIYVDHIVQ